MRNAGDLGILLREALLRIDHDHAHARALHRHARTQDAVFFNRIIYAAFAPEASRINKNELTMAVFDQRIRCIARGACDIGYDHALFSRNGVDKRGFPHIWLADHSHLDRVVFLLLFPFGRRWASTASSKSPVPWPCAAETAIGSPNPKL